MFNKGSLDEEDRQAEEAYDFCERRVWERHERDRVLREKKLKEEPQKD